MNPIWHGAGGFGLIFGIVGIFDEARAVTPLTTTRVASGLTRPVFVTAPPGDTARLFIVEQRGSAGVSNRGDIKILNLGAGTVNATPFLSITGLSTASEQGLLGLAFDPAYASTGRFYVYYTANVAPPSLRIARGTVSANPNVANAALTTLVTIEHPTFANHNGGWLGFGSDGYLYAAIGDGGDSCGPSEHSQNIDVLLGKMLRLDVSGAGYTSPAGNPFVGASGADEVWAYGLRNPWRSSFDRLTHDLFIADVGQNEWEELNFQPASDAGGVNYGWDCMEGTHCSSESGCSVVGCTCDEAGLTGPILDYSHDFGCSITGGYVYRGCAIPDLRGTYFYADYCSITIWSLRYTNGVLTGPFDRTVELDPAGAIQIETISSFGEDGLGEIYIVDQLGGGEVYKIVPNGAVDPPSPQDYDNDGDVDSFDVLGYAECLNGEGDNYGNCLCDVFDEDTDGDVDLKDYAALQIAINS